MAIDYDAVVRRMSVDSKRTNAAESQDPALLAALSHEADARVKIAVAMNPYTPNVTRDALKQDWRENVRKAAWQGSKIGRRPGQLQAEKPEPTATPTVNTGPIYDRNYHPPVYPVPVDTRKKGFFGVRRTPFILGWVGFNLLLLLWNGIPMLWAIELFIILPTSLALIGGPTPNSGRARERDIPSHLDRYGPNAPASDPYKYGKD